MHRTPVATLHGQHPLRTTPAAERANINTLRITVSAIRPQPDGSTLLAVSCGEVGLRAWLPPGSPAVQEGQSYCIEQDKGQCPLTGAFTAIYPASLKPAPQAKALPAPAKKATQKQTGEKRMHNITPFQFEHHTLRVQTDEHGQPWFNANDVCNALEMGNPRQAIESHVDDDDVQKLDTIDSMGRSQQANHINESGLYALILGSTKPEAKKFKRWVTAEVLPAIRKTGSYQAPTAKPAAPLKLALEAARAFPALVRAARLLGCDKNVAAISANNAIYQMTQVNLMQQLGHTHLIAENQTSHWLTPTELGRQIGASARGVNLLLAEAGLQAKIGDKWQATDAGRDFCRLYDTGKRHASGSAITQLKWSHHVLPLLGQQEAA